MVVQYPAASGEIKDYSEFCETAKKFGAQSIFVADLLSLALFKPPGEFGADIVVGSSQRFGVPMGFGGPHAAYLATKVEYKRFIPGRIIGVSKDTQGKPALRLALQTREQHIRREKATSNICTAQVLLAVLASMYAVYHGPQGLRKISRRIFSFTHGLKKELESLGYSLASGEAFDTIEILASPSDVATIKERALKSQINFAYFNDNNEFVNQGGSKIRISVNELTTTNDLLDILNVFAFNKTYSGNIYDAIESVDFTSSLFRADDCLKHPIFNSHHNETDILRYIRRLESKDLSLAHSMIPLGSCTMKLNATSEMVPVSWPEFAQMHPFCPLDQATGYLNMFSELEKWLAEITGYAGISLQPNAGSQGEYAGLLVIKKYHESRNEGHRDICLIPSSAHGTNPASAAMAGMKVVVVACDENGNIDLNDLRAKCDQHKDNLSALMITYPSTHGVFEETVVEVCDIIHKHGGQVYLDGANMNALVGLAKPGEFGSDVSHLNLHKTFCIPHGGGGPGVGPIGVAKHLVEFLPGHGLIEQNNDNVTAIAAAPWGSASILPISWGYLLMMGREGLKKATEVAILNANYIAKKLEPYFPILYRGHQNLVAHECIIDLRPLKAESGIDVNDVAKRLMDYGFHAPTMSWPVAGTLMIEPTESESKAELDRFCEAMISIHDEIKKVASGEFDKENNVLINAPHTIEMVASDTWDKPYSREIAAYPLTWLKEYKFWPAVGRVDNAFGDKNLFCTCPTMDDFK